MLLALENEPVCAGIVQSRTFGTIIPTGRMRTWREKS